MNLKTALWKKSDSIKSVTKQFKTMEISLRLEGN